MIRKLDENRRSIRAEKLVSKFANNIVGQPEATEALVYLIEKHQAGFYDRSKPLASFLFLGPTGTGKTSVAEEFVNGVFGKQDFLMKVDCGEFQHSHEIAKLVGSPPGYLGHRETHPYFTNARIKERQSLLFPFTVILWDEIEKASDALWNLMLGILDKGRLTTGTNELIDMKNTVHIMTSNVGSAEMSDDVLGFHAGDGGLSHDRIKDIAFSAARRKFMPEFLGRIDKMVMFKTLSRDEIKRIMDIQLARFKAKIEESSNIKFRLYVSPAAYNQLITEGYDRRENARYLKKTLEQRIGMPLATSVASIQIFTGDDVVVDYKDGQWSYYASTGNVNGSLPQGQLEVSKVLQP